jgi:hypothetical protein
VVDLHPELEDGIIVVDLVGDVLIVPGVPPVLPSSAACPVRARRRRRLLSVVANNALVGLGSR